MKELPGARKPRNGNSARVKRHSDMSSGLIRIRDCLEEVVCHVLCLCPLPSALHHILITMANWNSMESLVIVPVVL